MDVDLVKEETKDKEEETPLTEEEQRQELLFRFRLLKECGIPIYYKNTMTLEKLKRYYDFAINKHKQQEAEKERQALIKILTTFFRWELDMTRVCSIDENPKAYTNQELKDLFETRLKEINWTEEEFLKIMNILAIVAMVSK